MVNKFSEGVQNTGKNLIKLNKTLAELIIMRLNHLATRSIKQLELSI